MAQTNYLALLIIAGVITILTCMYDEELIGWATLLWVSFGVGSIMSMLVAKFINPHQGKRYER